MTLEMSKEEYIGMLKYLTSKPFVLSDYDLLVHAYGWRDVCRAVIGTTGQLRARVSRNAVKEHLDSKNPVPAATGNGKRK